MTDDQQTARGSLATVLVCEDEVALRELVRIALDGYEVIEAEDGEAALELARREHPDVALVDLMLPRASGLDVIRALKGDPATARVRIIAVSAWREQEAEVLEAGADGFVSKPFDPEELRILIEGMLPAP